MGSLLPRKRHAVLFAACADLVRSFPAMRLLVAGPAPTPRHMSETEAAASAAGVIDRTVFTGPVDDMVGCYNSIDILCMPSINEGFGYAAAEAMSCGRPVIVSDASSLPEVVGPDGMIFPVDDAVTLRGMISRLAGDPGSRAAAGVRGRNRVVEVFSIGRMLDDVEDYFREMIGRRGAGA